MLEAEQVQSGILTYSYLLKGELNAILGIEDLSRRYVMVTMLIDPELRNILLHLILKKNIFNFRHRPSEFYGNSVFKVW